MNAIQNIFRLYGPQYLARYGERMPKIHKKAIRDITNCRNGSFGTLVYQCPDCRTPQVVAWRFCIPGEACCSITRTFI